MLLRRSRATAIVPILLVAALCDSVPAQTSPPPPPASARPAVARKFHQYLRQHWSLEEGLPQVGVGDLAQDAHGFLWIGTQNGLARFDGLDFHVFTTDTSPGLAGDSIVRLAFDDTGLLWIGTRTGLSAFDGVSFHEVQSARGSVGVVHGMTVVPGGVLIGTDTGLHRGSLGALQPVSSVPDARVFFADPQTDGALIIGVPGGIHVVSAAGTRAFSLAEYGNDAIPKVHLRGCGGEWIATSVGLVQFAQSGLRLFEPLARKNINDLHCDDDGTLWVGTGSGLFRVQNGAVFEAIEDERQLPHPFVTAFLHGTDGGLWFGTLTGGVYRLTDGRYIRHNTLNGLPFSATFAIDESRTGGIWIGGQDGVVRYRDGKFERVIPIAGDTAERLTTALLEDRAGHLWIGTRSGLMMADLATGHTSRVLDGMVMALTEAPDGTIWIGGVAGLFSYRDGRLLRVGADQGIVRVRAIVVSPRYGLLVGTEQGVIAADARAEHGPFDRFDSAIANAVGRVGALFEDPEGNVWAGYLGNGLGRYAAASGAWTLFTERHGLLSNTVYGIRIGRDNRVWIATQTGVARIARAAFDRVAAGERSLLEEDVVISIGGREPGSSAGYCCNGGAGSSILLASDGSLWLPTLDGVVQIDTAQSQPARRLPPAVLVSLRHGTHVVPFDRSARVEVPPDERDVELAFGAPLFDQPGLTRFHYQLEGYDAGWKEIVGRRSVSYTNLPPRTYRFRVRSGAIGAIEGTSEEASWSFVIQPRFTETWWFYGFLAPLVIGSAYGAHSLRLRRLEQQRARLERLVTDRTGQLKDANEQLARANARLQELSYTDPLTQLHNRRYLSDFIGRDLAQVMRLREQPGSETLSVVFVLMDLDHFKQINDVHGHEAGDRILAETARRLIGVARETDRAVRWGGEEFLLVVCFSPREQAARIAERVAEALWREPFVLADVGEIRMTGSIGFSVFPFAVGDARTVAQDESAWQSVVALADYALYQVKQNGRDGWAGMLPATTLDASNAVADVARDPAAYLARGDITFVSSR